MKRVYTQRSATKPTISGSWIISGPQLVEDAPAEVIALLEADPRIVDVLVTTEETGIIYSRMGET